MFLWINDLVNNLPTHFNITFNLEFVDLFWFNLNDFKLYQSTLEVSTISFFDLIFIFFYQNSDYFFFLYFFLDLVVLISLISSFYIDFITSSLSFSYFIYFNSLDPHFVFFFFDFSKFLLGFSDFSMHSINYDSYFINLFIYFIKNSIYFLFIIFSIIIFIIFCPITTTVFNFFIPFALQRLVYFLLGVLFEYRIPTNFIFLFIFAIFWFFFLIFFSEPLSDIIDVLHSFCFFYFIFFISFFLFRYSIHFFSFLEITVTENVSVNFLFKQFIRDCSNLVALFLRFFLLIFRLNIYDSLDDFLDSYYIFLCDFDEDFLFNELGFSLFNDFYFYIDNQNDTFFFTEIEFFHFFSFFFIFWGKFFFFIFFILEEFFRLSLSIYIIYLILFEIHSTNISYKE